MRFRKIFTRFCQLPGVIIPLVVIGFLASAISGSITLLTVSAWMWVVTATLIVCFLCGALIKFIYYKERPHPQDFITWWQKVDASSFPSIHTAYATIFMLEGLALCRVLYRTSTDHLVIKASALAIGSIAFYVLIARSRIVLKKHFFIDIVFGTLLGMVAFAFAWSHIDAIIGVFSLVVGG